MVSYRSCSAVAGSVGLRRRDAIRLAAAIELARRASLPIVGDQQLFHLHTFAPRLVARHALHVQEHLGVIFLDTRGRILGEREVFVGTLYTATVSTRDVVRLALNLHARSIVVFHNHPSGDSQPSADDVAYTRRLSAAAQLLDVEVLDHLVLGSHRYSSMKQQGYF